MNNQLNNTGHNTFKFFAVSALAILAAACARGLPKPDSSLAVSHTYNITFKNQDGTPISGLAVSGSGLDYATQWGDGYYGRSATLSGTTDKNGQISLTQRTYLAQYWKGGYLPALEEAELAHSISPGERSAWGYLSKLSLTDPLVAEKVVFDKSGQDRAIDLSYTINTPKYYGKPGRHDYRYIVLDRQGAPVPGATVSAKADEGAKSVKEPSAGEIQCTTDSQGECTLSLAVYMRPTNRSVSFQFESSLSAIATAKGFSSEPDYYVLTSLEASASMSRTIKIPTAQDYYCPELRDPKQAKLGGSVEKWAIPMMLAGLEREVRLDALCVERFKEKNYLSIGFAHSYKFNQAKLTNYGIGARIFDDVVRKLLMASSIAAMSIGNDGYNIEGYLIKIQATSSNFADSDAKPRVLNYSYYLPRGLAKRYRDADVSGQQLANGSIILLDGERIDLDLTR